MPSMRHGLDALKKGSFRPKQTHVVFAPEQAEQLRALLHRLPRDFGYPTQPVDIGPGGPGQCGPGPGRTRVSGETIRQTLKRLGVGWKRAKHWITSPDPQYARKKAGATV